MQWKRFTLIIVGVLAFLGALLLLSWPGLLERRPMSGSGLSSSGRPASVLTVAGCVGSAGPLVPREFLDGRHVAAASLVSQRRFDRAVEELRNIAEADPAYPGINLDLSDALLQSDHAQQAKNAINSQTAISDCLIGLPDQALRDYCDVELDQANKEICRSQLAQMQRAAHFQAALIDMAMASSIRPSATPEVAKSTYVPVPDPQPASKSPPSVEIRPVVAATPKPEVVAKVAPAVKDPAAAFASERPKPVLAAASAAIQSVPAAPVRVAASVPPQTSIAATPALVETAAAVQPASLANRADELSRTSGAASGTLLPSEAAQHIGETRTVCGPVADKHTAATANGSPTFVELERAYPNQIFTVLIWGSDKGEVGDLPASGNVCVTGKIATYAGLPEIILHTAHDWSVSHGTPNP